MRCDSSLRDVVWTQFADIHTRDVIHHADADFFLRSRLDDILEEGIHHRAAQQVLREQLKWSLKQKRRKESLFHQVRLEMAKEQEIKFHDQ